MPQEPESPEEALEKLASYAPRMAEELGRRLLDAGVLAELRADPLGGGAGRRVASRGGYGASILLHVYVPARDLARARSIESRFVRENVPDLPEGFDPERLAADRCPACDTSLPSTPAAECPECGLHLGE